VACVDDVWEDICENRFFFSGWEISDTAAVRERGVSTWFLENTEYSVEKLRTRRCTLDILYVYLKYQLF
jgi:hypothetical protein